MAESALYDLFWRNSELSAATLRGFGEEIEAYTGVGEAAPAALQYPGGDLPLHRPSDRQIKQMRRRASERRFAEAPLDARRLGAILAAFAVSDDGVRRPHGSAGATYPLEIYCLLNNCEGPAAGHVAYYNADNHSLAAVAELAPWAAIADAVNLDSAGTVPQLVVIFVLMPERVTAKYGERGGRFALIEVGHAAQNLALRLVQVRLVGCALGGMLDDRVKALLGLEGTSAQIALGYACGIAHSR